MAEVRLIDANALKRDLIDNWAFYSVLMKNALDRQPTIDPASLRPKGRWEDGKCSVCKGRYMDYADADSNPAIGEPKPNFCPDCGADMRAL